MTSWPKTSTAWQRLKRAWAELKEACQESEAANRRLRAARLLKRSADLDPWPLRKVTAAAHERGALDAIDELKRRGRVKADLEVSFPE